ncbi:hypothetical protein [Gloeothece verrucosa]|uniref:Uncharacterized protein n=1 Tax=Gloeothece verrucosa (strain PCC 7822) TaxID=497965 RepID=E0UN16_GLOV7|nr:hypothetical protein [Gloeothece verrucosa]ADN18346.1 conserved hypothetical protein [Gloeothece verrucosa PCC 7822]
MNSNSAVLRISSQIASLEASGEIAEANTWISRFIVYKPSGKKYIYYRLMRAVRDKEGKIKRKFVRYLGKKNSSEHKQMKKAIARRNRIQALQRQLKRLMAQGQPQRERGNRGSSGVNSPLTTSDRMLLVQLQQQLGELMQRFERLERFVGGRQNSSAATV